MSAKVLEASEGLTARQILGFTSRNDAMPLKEVENGTVIPYCGHILQEIVNESTGEAFESMLLISEPDENGIKKLGQLLGIVSNRSERSNKIKFE